MIPSPKNHPLLRDGQSQLHRVPPTLDPASAPLDDRGIEDLLAETSDVARLVRYYDLNRNHAGTWAPFFDRHPIAQLALLTRDTAEAFRARNSEAVLGLAAADPNVRRKALATLARVIAADAARLAILVNTIATTPFAQTLSRALDAAVIAAVRAAVEASHAFLGADGPAVVAAAATDRAAALWGWSAGALRAAFAGSAPAFADVRDAVLGALGQLARLRAFLSTAATTALNDETFNDGRQPPHLGLLLAYLQLFRHGQDAINDLLRRHLEYYYRDIVGFRTQSAVSDHAYVVFELARGVSSFLLPVGTTLYAGRDTAKQDISFELPRDAALNRARVDGLRSTFRDSTGRWRSALVANSSDGLGAALPEDDPNWSPFGHAGLPPARFGWALATPALATTGGAKRVSVSFRLAEDAADALISRIGAAVAAGQLSVTGDPETALLTLEAVADLALTGPEGWHAFPSLGIEYAQSARTLSIVSGQLDARTPITAYDPARHGCTYETSYPVLEVAIRAEACPIELFAGLALESVTATVSVADDTALVLASDIGPLDPAKPFEPFGPRPISRVANSAGSRFLIGSREIFSKRLLSLAFNLEWKGMPEDLDEYYRAYFGPYTIASGTVIQDPFDLSGSRTLEEVEVETPSTFTGNLEYLDGGAWKPLGAESQRPFGASLLEISSDIASYSADPDTAEFTAYSPDLQRGYIRLELTSPSFGFGHEKYPFLLIREAARAAGDPDSAVEISPPVTPTLARFSATYAAVDLLDLSGASTAESHLEFFHVEPHGEQKQAAATGLALAPSPVGNAALFVGLAEFTGGSNLSLLFQLADGSGDPFAAYPDVGWSYLSGNTWREFASHEIIVDTTLALRRTGLLTVSVPADATTQHTLMPAGRIWLRALASGDTRALNQAREVVANAAEAIFKPTALNDLSRLATALPAGTIKKLVVTQPSVKKITQPLPSFGGDVGESGSRFHRRASERLRHRLRAVELWDHERLVLENFPALYLAKCIPHSTPASALAPGNALIVVAPDPKGLQSLHPLQPAATQDVLATVREFLVARCSGLARLEVANPLYEELQVITKIKLLPGYDVGIYAAKLAEELTGYLAPWTTGDVAALRFAGELHPSQILNFIEERTYVDYVTDFRVRQWIGGAALSPDPVVLRGSTARSILTSHSAHALTVA